MTMAEAFFLSAAANAVGTMMTDYLVKPVERRIRYLFRFRMIVEELEQQKSKLTAEQDRVKDEVKEAKLQTRTRVIANNVDEWLTKAEDALKGVQSLECRIEEDKRCFRWCPNWSWRYQLSKEMDDKKKHMADLVENSKFERYGHRAELPGLEFLPSKDFVPSETSTAAFSEIMKALKDEKMNMIGVWGMGGVGKTTLVNEVGRKAKELQLFQNVIQVVVSQTSVIENIQETIKDFLNLTFEKTTVKGKAEELWLRLEEEEKVLIILDDMWNKLQLEQIGLPLADQKGKGCKIILTTRRKTLCEDMKCDVNVPVDVLNDEEAWDLFRIKAANLERASRDIVKVAEKVAKECKGLPVAIVTLARALKDAKTRKEWELALKKVESSKLMEIANIEEEETNAYKCIKISYEYLKKETTRRCLSMCALYPEDYSIDVEDLIRFAWGLGLYKDDSIEETRIHVSQDINYLKDSCMLLEDTQSHVKLHDVVRDVVLWIASMEESNFVMKSRLVLLDKSSESSCKAISLLDDEEKKFPESLEYPKLEILLLNHCDIQGTCFEKMNELKVLSLRVSDYKSTGVISLYALKFLRKLRSLHLENFDDFSFLGDLKTLESLSLFHSRWKNETALEGELGKLENLMILDLANFRFSSTFPFNVIQRLSKLEELYLRGSSFVADPDDILLKLTSLRRLERYDIHVLDSFHLTERSWKIDGGYLSKVISLISENLEYLQVDCSTDEFVECLIDHKTQQKVSAPAMIQQLKCVVIRYCVNLKVVFQMEEVEEDSVSTPRLLSNLRVLYLDDLPSLSCIWDLPIRRVSLESLVELRIVDCPSLEILFRLFLAQSLVLLETLEISRCHGLMQLVEEVTSTTDSHDALWFPKLTKLSITDCDVLECIFPMTIPQGLPQLSLVIKDCPQIKQVVRVVENGINVLQQQLRFLGSFCDFEVSNCPHLDEAYSRWHESNLKKWLSSTEHIGSLEGYEYKNLVPEGNDDGLNGLISLDVRGDCEVLECLVDTTTKNGPTPSALAHLEMLHIKAMDGLETLCKGEPPQVFLENLKSLKVECCHKIVSLSPIGKLLNLQQLDVRDCTSLRVVFQMDDDDEVIEENQDQKPLSNLQSIELRTLNELKGLFKGSPHSFSLQSLTSVIIYECPKVEYLFLPSVIPSLVVLEKLVIESCDGLKALFRPELENDDGAIINPPLFWPKLKTLFIKFCSKLEYALPITVAQGLPALEWFKIHGCEGLKQVFSGMPKKLDGIENDAIVLLVSLRHITLEELPELTSFVPENYIVKAPALKYLETRGCPRICNFSLQQTNKELALAFVQLSVVTKSLHTSKDLTLWGIDDDCKTFVPDIVDLEDLEELTSFCVKYFWNLESLVNMSGSCKSKSFLQNLKKLTIVGCHELKQVFRIDELCYDQEENQAVPMLFFNLEHLELEALPSLRWIINAASTLYVSLQRLTVLSIQFCENLDYLFPVSVLQSLSSLEKVIIKRCDRLKSVFMDRTDQSNNGNLCLQKLKTVEIQDCLFLEYVFPLALARGFPRLQEVRLSHLQNLRHFVAGAKYVEAPELEILNVSYCPRCTAFIIQKEVNNHVPLKDLTFNMQGMVGEDAESCETVNTHSSPDFEYITAGNFEQMLQLQGGYFISSLEKMKLHHMIWLQHIWKGQIHVATNLRELELHNCNSLTYIFPVTLIRHYLPHMCILKVRSCDNLKLIIANDGSLASSSQAAQLEMKMVFPQLKQIEFENLSRLESFSPVGYHVVFPCLELLEINECFKMISTFTVDYMTLTVHDKTDQASHSQLDDTSPSPEVISWSRRRYSMLPPFVEEGAQKISPLKEISMAEV